MRGFSIIALSVIAFLMLNGCSKPVSGSTGADIKGTFIQLDIRASSSCLGPGETVKLDATAENRGKKPLTLRLENHSVLDISVDYEIEADENRVKVEERWSKDKALTEDLTQLDLKPGESKRIQMDWIAQRTAGMHGTVSIEGVLRYGEDDSQQMTAHTSIFVERCPTLLNL